jgi:ADP-heptose:LPS heptosyltransferase
MHILTLEDTVDLGSKQVIKPDSYLIDDINAAHLLVLASRGTMNKLATIRTLDETQDWNNKRILVMRAGGFGDLVLLTPVLREIKRRWPSCYIAVSTMATYAQVISNLPYVDHISEYPIQIDNANTFDAWVFLENAIERNPRAEEVHMTELFGEIAGISSIEDIKPDYKVKATEAIWANEAYPRVEGTRRCCIQIGTSALCRTYPRPKLGEVCTALIQKGWEVFLLGANGEIRVDKMPHNMRNLADADLTLRQSAAVMNNADVFLGSDSALLHIAGALAVPAVGLYGPFPWFLRTKHCPTTVAISGTGACAPCFHHVNSARRNHFPDYCPSKSKGICQVLEDISPARIVTKLESIARNQIDMIQ